MTQAGQFAEASSSSATEANNYLKQVTAVSDTVSGIASSVAENAQTAETFANKSKESAASALTASTNANASADAAALSATNAANSAKEAADNLSLLGASTLTRKEKDTFIHVNDAFPTSLFGIKIEGACKQDGTPSPENPVPI